MIHLSWINHTNRDNETQLQTATKQQLSLDGSILLHLYLVKLGTRIRFNVVSLLAVITLLAAPFVVRFVRAMFLTERKVVSWSSEPVAIVAHMRTLQNMRISNAVSYSPAQVTYQNVNHDAV